MADRQPNVAPAGDEVTLPGSDAIFKIPAAIERVREMPNDRDKYDAIRVISEKVQDLKDMAQEYAFQLQEIIDAAPGTQAMVLASMANPGDTDNAIWTFIQSNHKKEEERLHRKQVLMNTMVRQWGASNATSMMNLLSRCTTNSFRQISALIGKNQSVPYDTIQPYLRDAVFNRIVANPKQGVQRTPRLQFTDFQNAYDGHRSQTPLLALTAYRNLQWAVNDEGWPEPEVSLLGPAPDIEPEGRITEVDSDGEDVDPSPEQRHSRRRYAPLAITEYASEEYEEDEEDEGDEGEGEAEPAGRFSTDDLSQPEVGKELSGKIQSTAAPDDDGPTLRIEDDDEGTALAPGSLGEGDEDLAATDLAADPDSEPSYANDDEETVPLGEDGEEETKNMKCNCVAVPNTLKALFLKKIPNTDSPAQQELARAFVKRLKNGGAICYKHTHAVGSNLGFLIKKKKHADIRGLIKKYHAEFLAGSLAEYKITPGVFRRSHRPWLPEDGLGPYRFAPQSFN